MQDEFSTLLTARKPREQTEQYKILAALYSLGAAERGVTAREVKDFLDLRLRKKAPGSVSTRLRDYSAYVRIAAEGPPLQWALTEHGVARLKDLSGGLTLQREDKPLAFLSDIGLICALEYPEFEAVSDAVGGADRWKLLSDARYTHVYRGCDISTDDGQRLSIVGTTSTSMGLTAASIATTQLVLQFRPRIVAMIGIAAGTRDGGKEFGDVLVADPSVDYNSGKVVWSNGVRGFLPDPYPISLNPRLRSVLLRFRGDRNIFGTIRKGWNGRLPRNDNRLHVGPVGAADQVIDDASRILEIQKNWRKLIGVEMETYGVYRACYESPDPKPRFVSFKAVCDFAAEKSDSWQDYAAYVAAQFAIRFFKSEWKNLWHSNVR